MADVRQTDAGEPLNEVNVIPLADLSLVLLIILMVLSPMIMQSMIKVQASKAAAIKSLRQQPPEPPLILALNPDGLSLNTVKIKDDVDLAAQLSMALGRREDKTVLFTADPNVIHGRFVQVLDLVKQQGAEKIALLKKAPASEAPKAKAAAGGSRPGQRARTKSGGKR
jgi:biopolymer transport protein ExbD